MDRMADVDMFAVPSR